MDIDAEEKGNHNGDSGAGSYVAYANLDEYYFGAKRVVEKEFEYIRWRRNLHDDDPVDNITGLALSGGGIRSASYSLGVMQALAHNGWLKNFDYLSTVSGGGYIGSSVSWLLSRSKDATQASIQRFGLERHNFPYGTYPMSGSDPKRRLSAKASEAQGVMESDGTGVTERYKGELLRYLRQQAKYLTPGDGINAMSLVAVVLRGALVSLSVYFGLLLEVFLVAAYPLASHTLADIGLSGEKGNLALWVALAVGVLFVLLSLVYALATNILSKRKQQQSGKQDGGVKSSAYSWRQRYERGAGFLLSMALVFLVIGAVPEVYHALQYLAEDDTSVTSDFQISGTRTQGGALQFSGTLEAPAADTNDDDSDAPGWVGALSTLFGMLSGVFAFFKSSSGKKGRIPMGLVVTVATAALWFGLLLLSYRIADWMWHDAHILGIALTVGAIAFGVGVLGWVANINYLSIHRYYRDRLMELFMPDVDKALAGEIATRAAATADKMPIYGLLPNTKDEGREANPAPYHIINTNVVLESSDIPKFRGRGGDNFILSPYFCGSNATGWRDAEHFMNGRMTLPTAMAISGAAVNPGTGVGGQGVTRQPLLSTLMGLLNIRLGYWAPNPDPDPKTKDPAKKKSRKMRVIPNYFVPGLCEVFTRWKINEKADYVQLTDGGHFENLGLYELIRRRARLIVICDGAADANFQFTDFANAVEKVRVDFGTLILCDCEDLQPLVPTGKEGTDVADDAIDCAKRGYIMCTIIYPDNTQGRLLYLKTTFFEELSADLYGYKKTHPQFPDEPTSDQFFDEKQFEAYRELGYQTAWRMMQDNDIRNDAFVGLLWANNC